MRHLFVVTHCQFALYLDGKGLSVALPDSLLDSGKTSCTEFVLDLIVFVDFIALESPERMKRSRSGGLHLDQREDARLDLLDFVSHGWRLLW